MKGALTIGFGPIAQLVGIIVIGIGGIIFVGVPE